MSLIDDVEGIILDDETVISWKEEDDDLLKTLFVNRGCALSVIASVFNKEESAIKNRLIDLNLIQQ